MAKSKKKDGPNIAGAALGTTFGGTIGGAAGKAKVIKDTIRTDVTRAHGKWHYSDLKKQKTKAKNKVWEMNFFNRLRGIADRYQFNIDPKFKSRMNYYRQQMGTPMPNSKITIAKWAVPPALAGGIVGSFVEKKAELQGENSMTKSEKLMNKLSHNVRSVHTHTDPAFPQLAPQGYGPVDGQREASVKSKVNVIMGNEDKSKDIGSHDKKEDGTYKNKYDEGARIRADQKVVEDSDGNRKKVDKPRDIRHIVNSVAYYNKQKQLKKNNPRYTYRQVKDIANRAVPTVEELEKKKAEQEKEGSYKAYNLFNKLKERN